MNKLKAFWNVFKWILLGFGIAFALFIFLFFKTHWIGFMKFVDDPKFFDEIKIERNFNVK